MKFLVHIGIIAFAAQEAVFKFLPRISGTEGGETLLWLGGLVLCALFAAFALFKMFQNQILTAEDLKEVDIDDVKLPDHWWYLAVLALIGADGIFNGLATLPKGASAMIYAIWVVGDVLCGAIVWLFWSHANRAHQREIQDLQRRNGNYRQGSASQNPYPR